MNGTIVELTFRQLLSQRRTIALVLAALVPVAIATAYRLTPPEAFELSESGVPFSRHQRFVAEALLSDIVLATLLPLAALIVGTAVLGSEIEDGTAVYLLSKPIPRWKVVLSKLAVAWAVTAAFIAVVIVAAGYIPLVGQPTETTLGGASFSVGNGYAIPVGFAVAGIAGALVYSAVFICVSVVTSRAFVAGLIYVFIWEGVVTRLFSGTRVFSVRQYTFSVAEWLSDVTPEVFSARLGVTTAVLMTVVVTALAFWLAVRQLEQFEIGEAA